MSINYSPLKLSPQDIQGNYISNTSPNFEQRNLFNNNNQFSSFPSYPNNQEEQNINNELTQENADSSYQKLSFNNNYSINDLINTFKNINNDNVNENTNLSNNTESNLLNELRKQYDERIMSLHENMKMVLSKIENDDILASMRDDMESNNSPFITNRIKEILDENFYKEKEKMIEKLSFENASLKNDLNNLLKNKNHNNNNLLNSHQQLQIKNLEKVINELNINIDSYNTEINNKNYELNNLQKRYNLLNNELLKLKQDNLSFCGSFGNNYEEFAQCKKNLLIANKEIERLNKVINVIEIDLNNAEEIQKEKDDKIEQLMNELKGVKNELLNTNQKYKKLLEENKNNQNIIKK